MSRQMAYKLSVAVKSGTLEGDELEEKTRQLNEYRANRNKRGRKSSIEARHVNRKLTVIKESVDKVPDQVVEKLTSLENEPGRSRDDQIVEDRLKVRVLNSRIWKNLAEKEHDKMVERIALLPDGPQKTKMMNTLQATLDKRLAREQKLLDDQAKKDAEKLKKHEEKVKMTSTPKASPKLKSKQKSKAVAAEATSSNTCQCGRSFGSQNGLRQHRRTCLVGEDAD